MKHLMLIAAGLFAATHLSLGFARPAGDTPPLPVEEEEGECECECEEEREELVFHVLCGPQGITDHRQKVEITLTGPGDKEVTATAYVGERGNMDALAHDAKRALAKEGVEPADTDPPNCGLEVSEVDGSAADKLEKHKLTLPPGWKVKGKVKVFKLKGSVGHQYWDQKDDHVQVENGAGTKIST
jgi:hypothetical protein